MSSTSRPPSSQLRSQVNDLRSMTWSWLSFTHVWIAIGAFTTTLLSGVWSVQRPPWDAESIAIATWVALSTGLGYSVQRAIKHAKHPQNMPSLRQQFWNVHGRRMLVGWGVLWVTFNLCFFEELQWDRPERQGTVALLGLASLAYSLVPGFEGGLRRVVWLKVPLIAGVWATATTLHPEVFFDPLIWAQRFVFIASLTLPFDIRDLDVDAHHIQTWASIKSPAWVLRMSRLGMLISAGMCAAAAAASWAHGATSVVGPLVCLAQSTWAWRLLQDSPALTVLGSGEEQVKERFAGWTLDGVLALPLWPLLALWLMTKMGAFEVWLW